MLRTFRNNPTETNEKMYWRDKHGLI